MATIEEVYEQIIASDEEKAAFAEAAQTPEGLAAFLAARGCEASTEEVVEFLRGKQGELADEELDAVAGGCDSADVAVSVVSFGLGCAVQVIKSAVKKQRTDSTGTTLCAV